MPTTTQTTNNKTHFIFPRELLLKIDKMVGKRKRSAFVIKATEEKLARKEFDFILRDAVGSWSDKNYPELKTKKDVEKYIRKIRKTPKARLKHLYE